MLQIGVGEGHNPLKTGCKYFSKMKTVVVLMLLIATIYCLPVKRSASSSESSEEHAVVQRPAPMLRTPAAKLVQPQPEQTVPSESNESTDSADDTGDAEDEPDADEIEVDNETNSTESESDESDETDATFVPPTEEPTLDPIINTGRGDSLGYPDDYKKAIFYVDGKDYEKIPSIVSKKMSAYDGQNINDVEKEIQHYKALKVHDDLLEEEDTSTPEMDAALGESEIALVGSQDNEGTSAGDSSSASTSQEETNRSPSNEETTATPGVTDRDVDSSQSTESQESDEDTPQTQEPSVVIAI
ncbi:osteopontin isoform X2 [Triplophysa rosa]|uniref:osteopontin isoform X2 n=1 Tax=Triplophysa rosa TaxID=992332 RepID=UPI002545DD3C|nr:osteopontin isoform X2 [Triplophysa rosa]